jgi:outer membrane protein TolC
VDLLIYDFGRISAKEAEAREQLVAAQQALAEEKLKTREEVQEAVFSLRRGDALLAVARTNEVQYARHLEQAQKRYNAQVAKKLDVTQARMNLSNAKLTLISASNETVTASAVLTAALGLTADEITRATLLREDENPIANLKSVRLDPTAWTPVEALALAQTNSPALKVARAKLRAASARVDYAIADLFPELSLNSAVNFSDPSFPATWNWSWGVKFVQSVFTGFRKTVLVDEAVIAMRQAERDLAVCEQDLSRQITLAVATRDTARQSFSTAKVVLSQAKENLDLALKQYSHGVISSIDLLDAESSYNSALGEYVKAAYVEQIAEAVLYRLVGI